MKVFYGWVIVAVGIVVTCVGFGAMATLSVFLQPMAEAMGWSRTGVATAALLNFLCMGVGAFMWGALSDRYGTRAVVVCGGAVRRVARAIGAWRRRVRLVLIRAGIELFLFAGVVLIREGRRVGIA